MRKLGGWWRVWIALSTLWMVIVVSIAATSLHVYRASDRQRDDAVLKCKKYLSGQEVDWTSAPVEELEAELAADLNAKPWEVYAAQDAAAAAKATTGHGLQDRSNIPPPPPGYVIQSSDGELAAQASKATTPTTSDPVDDMLAARAASDGFPNEIRQLLKSCIEAKRHDYQADETRERKTNIVYVLAFGLIPPAVLLMLGVLVSWVIAGFRKSHP